MSTIPRAGAGPAGSRHRRVSIFEHETFLGYLLLVPTIAVLATFLAFPFLYGAALSMTSTEVGDLGLGTFVALANYAFEALRSGIFRTAFRDNFSHTLGTPLVELTSCL